MKGLVLAIVLTALSLTAQDVKPQEPAKSEEHVIKVEPKKIDDKEALLTLQLLASKRALAQSNYANLLRQLQDTQVQFEQINNDLNAKVDELYKKNGLDRTKVDVNFETGEVQPLAPPPAPKK